MDNTDLPNWIARIRANAYDRQLKKREKLIKKWKPTLVDRWKSNIEKTVHEEYEEELEKLGDEIYCLKSDLAGAVKERDYHKSRYEASCDVQDKLLNKVEKTSTKTGELRKEVKQLNNELDEIKESITFESDVSSDEIVAEDK